MAVAGQPARGEVVLAQLSPTGGSEITKTRPCLLVSPDDLNAHLRTFIVVPLTRGGRPYPFRIPCKFQGKAGHLVIDQIRTIDRERVVKRLGRISPETLDRVLDVLQEMFTR